MSQIKRTQYIDVLRSVAILLMFYAHLLPHFIQAGAKESIIERILSSLAAPIFLFLVGVNFNSSASFLKTSQRMLIVFCYAAIIDVFIWGIYPFYSFDVMYTIAFSLLFLFFIVKSNKWMQPSIVAILIAGVCFVSFGHYYNLKLNEPYLGESYSFASVLYNLFVNGWFPLIPWLLFPLLGLLCNKFTFKSKILKLCGVLLFIGTLSLIFNSNFGSRPFAVEIFYPAHFVYLAIALTWLFMLWTNREFFNNAYFKWLTPFGKTSFFLYGFHLTMYHFFADKLIAFGFSMVQLYLGFIILFYLTALALEYAKLKWNIHKINQVTKIVFGG